MGDDNTGLKIMVPNGSPRPNGNSSTLVKHFKEGVEESEGTVFNPDFMYISGCEFYLGENTKDSNGLCLRKDEVDKVYPVYEDADIAVLASPLYYWNLS